MRRGCRRRRLPCRHDRFLGAPTRTAYDAVAQNYAALMRIAMVETSLDLAMLENFTNRVSGLGPVLDADAARAM